MKKKAPVIWFTGLAGSGKTTYSLRLASILKSKGIDVEILDGDTIREMFGNDLGFCREDRIRNIKRITNLAKMISKWNITVLVANIAPYFEARNFIRKNLKKYIQIYLKTDIRTLKKRGRREFYSKAERGCIRHVIGVDDPYEQPRQPNITIDTTKESIKNGINKVLFYLRTNKITD